MIDKVNLRDSYKTYRKTAENPVEVKIYMYIILGFFKYIMGLVFEGHDIRLFSNLGFIGIRGKKVKPFIDKNGIVRGLAPSWSKTKKFWTEAAEKLGLTFKEYLEKVPKEDRQLVYCFNEHTNGISYRLVWYKKKALFTNKNYYALSFSRTNRRLVHKYAHEGRDYLVMDNK